MKKIITLSIFGVLMATTAFAQSFNLAGTAINQAKKPFSSYKVELRDIKTGMNMYIAQLNENGTFSFTSVLDSQYIIQLLDGRNKVVCTEGPINNKNTYIVIDCSKNLAALWLIGAAGAAGITAGVVAAEPASPSR